MDRIYRGGDEWIGLDRIYRGGDEWIGLDRIYRGGDEWIGLDRIYRGGDEWIGLDRIYRRGTDIFKDGEVERMERECSLEGWREGCSLERMESRIEFGRICEVDGVLKDWEGDVV